MNIYSLQILLAVGTIILMLKLLLDKLQNFRSRRRMRKRKKAFESNMWAIE